MLRRTLLGDIYIFDKRSRQFYSLSRLLCAKNLAVYAESYYREKVMLLEHSLVDNRYLMPDSEVAVHMDTKLRRMEQLRLVNLEHELDGHVQGTRGIGNGGSESDEYEELEESALCDNSSQLAQELFHNLSIRHILRSESVSDFPEVGSSMSPNFQKHELDGEIVDGSHDEQPHPTSLMEQQVPRRLMEIDIPMPEVEMSARRPLMDIDIPVQAVEKSALRPLMDIDIPMRVMEKQTPKPFTVEFPKPPVGLEIPKPLDGIEFRKPLVGIEIPKPLDGIEFRKPLVGIEIPKLLEATEIPKPLDGIEFRKPLVGIEIPKLLEATEIPKPLEEIDILKLLEATEIPKALDGIEFRKPLVGIEIPKLLEATEIPKPLEEIDVLKPLEATEIPKPLEEIDILQPLEEIDIPQSLEATEIPKPLEEMDIPQPLEATEIPQPLEATEISKLLEATEISKPLEATEILKSLEATEILKPLEATEILKPLEATEILKPLEATEILKSLETTEILKPLEEIDVPKPLEAIDVPKPLEATEILKPLEATEISKPLEATEILKPLEATEISKPLEEIEIPKPLEEIEIPKPLEEMEIPKQLDEMEIPKQLDEVEIPKQLDEVEIPKPLDEVEIPKQLDEMETPKPVMEFETTEPLAQTLNTLMEDGIPESAEKDKLSKIFSGNRHSHARRMKGRTDGEKKIRKEFKIFFDERDNLPNLEVEGFYEVFHVFLDHSIQPINNFRRLSISRILFRNIERQVMFEQPTPIQKWAIPAIVNGDDLLIIGEPKTGKTLSYILGVLEVFKLKMEVGQFHLGKGPLAVILGHSFRTCEFIFRVLTLLTTKKDRKVKVPLCKLNVRFVNNSLVERHSMPYVVNRCDVLISTPQCLLKILNNRSVSDLNKLNIVVFDGADLCGGEQFLTEMKLLLNHSKLPTTVQKIFCGERWTYDFEVVARTFMQDHSAVIGSHLEAAVYANLQPNVLFIDAYEKDRILLDLTLQKHKGCKVAVVCNNTEEVFHVETLFKNENKICLAAHSESEIEELKYVRYSWGRLKEWCVVVCTQNIINSLGIRNADVLINYSLPSDKEVSFRDRFTLIAKKMRDYIIEQSTCPLVDFFIDDKAYFRIRELMDFLQRMEIEIPPSLREEVEAEIEASEQELPLCENILKFGNCKEIWKCNKRHNFIKAIDFPANPLCGIVKFLILKVHNICHLSARIIELSDQQNNYKKVVFPDMTLQITRQLRNIFRDKRRRIHLQSVKVGALCVLNRNDASGMRFHRAKIIEIKELVQPLEVIVKLIDWGCVLRANVSKLLELPEELQAYPPLATDLYLCNLAPKDFDTNWSDRDISFAENMFMMELEENQVWIGRIKLSLESTLLVDPVKLCHALENENGYVIEFSASQRLIYTGIADEKPEHTKMLYALCEKANVDTSIYEYNLEDSENTYQPECAYFDDDFPKIQFIYAENPTSLYVRISKFEDLLMGLEIECNADGIHQKDSEDCNLNNPVLRKKLSVGMCCLALNGTSWNRAKILSFEKDRAKVFFIDYGDTEYVEHVVPISEKLLMKLPAQAIECYLAGVNPEMKSWDKTLTEIYDFSKNGNEELSVNVVEKVMKSELTGGWKYGINLLNAEGKSLNKKLIDLGLVQPTINHLGLAIDMEKIPQTDDANGTDADTWDGDCDEHENKERVDLTRFENLSIVDSASGNDLNKALDTPEVTDDLSYFLTMESGVFDDDSACCMLEEFLCNLAPEQVNRREPQNEAKTDEKEDEPVPENNETVIQEEERVNDVPQEAPQEETPAEEIVENGIELDEAAALEARLNYLLKRNKPANKTLPYLKYVPDRSFTDINKHLIPTDVLTPEILWSQTHTEIEVKIMLTNVGVYKFDCLVERFMFRCVLDKKPYVSNVKLFGAINPETTRVEVKTFFVQIVLQKLCPLIWPRLCRENKKFRWIKYNIEHFKEKKSTISEILCSQAMERIKSGNIIVPKVTDEIKFVPSSSSEGSDWSDSEGEEV